MAVLWLLRFSYTCNAKRSEVLLMTKFNGQVIKEFIQGLYSGRKIAQVGCEA